jgi:hypothetical protein
MGVPKRTRPQYLPIAIRNYSCRRQKRLMDKYDAQEGPFRERDRPSRGSLVVPVLKSKSHRFKSALFCGINADTNRYLTMKSLNENEQIHS